MKMSSMIINLNNIEHNINEIRKITNSEIIAMIKADAYGLGDLKIAKFLNSIGINIFGVALVKEAIKLRKNNISNNILITSGFLKSDIKNILKYNLTVSASNLELLKELNKKASNKVNIHIKVDTGMTRLGFDISELPDAINYINKNLTNINIEGIYTHLSSADCDYDYTLEQLNKFDNLIKSLNHKFKYIHCLNSSGLLNFSNYSYNTIRIGILMYGYYPDLSLKDKINILPSVTLKSKILHIREISKDTYISYSKTFKSNKDMKVATIGIGYADGLDRKLSNNYSFKYNDIECKILGNICMDMCMIDITNIEDIKIGDEVTIFEKDKIYDMCQKLNTIDYEILSRISKRIDRKYIYKK
jgi:alanine racemase